MRWITSLSFVLVVGCAQPATPEIQPEMRVVHEAVEALGGRSAVDSVRTLTAEGTGEYFFLGQNRSPDSEQQMFEIKSFQRITDLAHERLRHEQVLEPRFLGTFPSSFTNVIGLDGDVAFEDDRGNIYREAPSVARDRRVELRHTAVGILQTALAKGSVVSNLRHNGVHPSVDVRTADGSVFTLTVDGTTRLPIKVASKGDQANLGDVMMETDFGAYQPAGAMKLPTRVAFRLDGHPVLNLRVTKNTVNGPTPDLSAPPAAKAEPADPAPKVTAEPLAKGVWLLGGESHHSVLVEFSDHAVLIEAPLSDARAFAVLSKAAELLPAKPVTHLVNTHHHFDHSAGVRAAVSRGLTIVAHEKSRRFLEAMMERPHTVAPDALAKKPMRMQLQGVEGRTVHQDGTRTMEIYATGGTHADTMLVVYLPKDRLLVEVDDYVPRPPQGTPRPNPFAASLFAAVASRKLDVERVVPLHGRIASFAEFEATVRSEKAQ
ncbi:MBL fold metallo-hydrolase [Pendulispora rubella]|uniref:MBL fold metallo-hydrolase n=1 Tax=Pendulispora rubella TaxID=2741070 RepID=A0ABZ2L394_9BACT